MRYVDSINSALRRIMTKDSNVVLLGEDIRDPYGGAFKVTKGLSSDFSDRVINTPISESAIVGIATGMAMAGFIPIVEIMFGDFVTLCADQIINGASKFVELFNMPIPMVIRIPVGAGRGYGPTHSQSLEGMFMDVPNIDIVCPSIYHDPGKILENRIANIKRPLLFIEPKSAYSQQCGDATECVTKIIDGGREIDSLEHISILTYGSVAPRVISGAALAFIEDEISSRVSIVSDLKAPWNNSLDLTIEEGRGWGFRFGSSYHMQSQGRIIPASEDEMNVIPGEDAICDIIIGIADRMDMSMNDGIFDGYIDES